MVDPAPYAPPAVRTPINPSVIQIFETAKQGRLVVCAGAGLSRSAPAALPSGATLGERLDERLESLVQGYESPEKPADLIAVADAGASLEGGERALRNEVLKLADFNEAEPNYGHKVMAELLCEGGVSLLLLWNWDTCIERVDVTPVRLQVSLSKSDLQNLAEPSIAKVHGCATRPETLLITSDDLTEPPVWADEATHEYLRGKTVVFIGVGDIADYAKRRLQKLREDLEEIEGGEGLDIWVVAPEIRSGWADSAWADLLPNLSEERRLELTADDFLDQLARLWVRDLLDEVQTATAATAAETQAAVQLVDECFNSSGAANTLRWLRRAAVGQRVGGSVVSDNSVKQLLVAYAVLTRETGTPAVTVRLKGPSALEIGAERIEALINCQAGPAATVRERARERAKQLANQGSIDDEATFLVAGAVVGPLHDDPDPELDLTLGEQSTDHLVVGSSAVKLSFQRASDLEKEA